MEENKSFVWKRDSDLIKLLNKTPVMIISLTQTRLFC
jgi:hypothetical protein